MLESALTGGEVSTQTRDGIRKQIAQARQQNTAPADLLNLMTVLVMGSPEIQLR